MANYASFAFYTGTYGGSLIPTEVEFDRMALRAEATIDYLTFDRIETATDAIKSCECELAEAEYRSLATGGKEVASEKVGTYSVTYATQTSERARQKAIVTRWLGHTGLMYRGGGAV
ncbi:MAG: hypothetical protein K0M69_15760 [Youngiibacter sp.]|nr:hypothetical protein [Youngiibacter sp.]